MSLTASGGKVIEVIVTFRKFKHHVEGGPKTITFSDERTYTSESAILSLVSFLQIRPKLQGPLFCLPDSQPITRLHFDRILRKCLSFCKLDSSKYKGHSFRIGAATAAAERGWSDSKIREMGRWNSDAFRKYTRP